MDILTGNVNYIKVEKHGFDANNLYRIEMDTHHDGIDIGLTIIVNKEVLQQLKKDLEELL